MSDAGFEDIRAEVARSVQALAPRQSMTEPPATPMSIVHQSISVQKQVERLVASAVEQARQMGCTWQEIGDALGISRQGAFQRFGRPIDPGTGDPMLTTAEPLAGAEPRALALFALIAAGQWEAARAEFDTAMLEALSADRLAETWAGLVSQIGAYEKSGAPSTRRMLAYTVVLVPLAFEAGDLTGRVVFHADGKIAGLRLLDPTVAEGFPFDRSEQS